MALRCPSWFEFDKIKLPDLRESLARGKLDGTRLDDRRRTLRIEATGYAPAARLGTRLPRVGYAFGGPNGTLLQPPDVERTCQV